MRRRPPTIALIWPALLALAGACARETPHDAFTATGEVIAFGGGAGGPANACFACHGLKGEGDGQLAPRLAGLPAGYLQKQLVDYAEGRRADEVMAPIARALNADARRRVADYYATLPPIQDAVRQATPANEAARRLYHAGDSVRGLAPCAACHGESGEGGGPANPPLAGQPSGFLAEQLRRWRRSLRRNDPQNVMLAISRRLTPAEIDELARYASAPVPAAASGGAAPGPSL